MADTSEPAPDSSPRSPGAAMIGELVGHARGQGLRLLLAALEHLLHQQSWARARLRPHAGRTLRVALDAPPLGGISAPEAWVRVDEQGLLRAAEPGMQPDASLLLKPSAAAAAALVRAGPRGLQPWLRIEGDVSFAAVLGELAQHLRWDAEEDLSKAVGDVAAHRIVGVATRSAGLLRDLGQRAESAVAQFLGSAAGPLGSRPQLRVLREEATALEQRINALQARIARLARSRAGLPVPGDGDPRKR